MKKYVQIMAIGTGLLALVASWRLPFASFATAGNATSAPFAGSEGYTGSVSCRKCHEKFYQLWSTSHHGLAMRPYTAEFAKKELTPQSGEITVGAYRYTADIREGAGCVVEQGPEEAKKYPIEHAIGGKNVYYFLTTLDRGRLQTLPVAYDVRKKEWFDMAASGLRHFSGQSEQPVNWPEWPYTFNTACYGCHVSQLATNYDLKSDTYRTRWREPGINCETCHGPAEEHIRVCEAAPKGTVPKDLKIIRGGRDFTKDQNNATCSTCHAKGSALTNTFKPGDRFFDHFDLVTLESPDYYPDGRDLGENYTYTSWIMSPCVKSGKLDCLDCHTSSGRYRFSAADKANEACLPCHQNKVSNAPEHTRHKADSPGNKCISCHMPMTEFARMRRSDHSMAPPTPALTIAFQSPNACNGCHQDKTPQWADQQVREWRERDYQAAALHRSGLIDAARKRDWSRLPDMLAYVEAKDRDEVFAASLIRLLRGCEDDRRSPVSLNALNDPSPLVRAAAAESLTGIVSRETATGLLRACADESRLVRVRAAAVLAGFPRTLLRDQDLAGLHSATEEYLGSLMARPDQWTSHYNLGNFFLGRDQLPLALAAFETASKFDPNGAHPLVNTSIVYARMGELQKAEASLHKALQIDPKSAPAHFNMGLLKAEQGDISATEKRLRSALRFDPMLAEAAYNLSVVLSKDRLEEAITWARKAAELRPREPKYAYTLGFFCYRKGDLREGEEVLRRLAQRHPAYADAYLLLGDTYEKQGRVGEATSLYRQALAQEGMSPQTRRLMETKLKRLSTR
ncbi:MAG: ammonia-forming cytochrome c nitrite reductase subunit c552 [Deltaproteobacteria bacterium]|nr:ammonia-forming cytochrome c nitrite reductase subunit c552 [Deltaproteobacteria bacterium]